MTKDDGGPAFPIRLNENEVRQTENIALGITARDYFAAQAIGACIQQCMPLECANGEELEAMFARRAYKVADAMLAERAKP